MRRLFLSLLAAGLAAGSTPPPAVAQQAAAAPPPRLVLPLACTLGTDCWIQRYVDRDSSPAVRDYACGELTQDGHNGTDIRIADMAAQRVGVNVLAAADGTVLRERDGMADISVRTTGLAAVEGAECGNGVVIGHGGGWETQYCHLAKGSLVVKPGQVVKAGQPIGRVGLSGESEYPHVHLTVRRGGVVVDPFSTDPAAACGQGTSLWVKTPPYAPRAVVNAGFAPGPVDIAVVEAGGLPKPDAGAPYLVAYVRALALRAGDSPSLTLFGPDGATLAPSPPATLQKDAQQRLLFVGKRLPADGWSRGAYRARYVVRAKGAIVLQRDFTIVLRP